MCATFRPAAMALVSPFALLRRRRRFRRARGGRWELPLEQQLRCQIVSCEGRLAQVGTAYGGPRGR